MVKSCRFNFDFLLWVMKTCNRVGKLLRTLDVNERPQDIWHTGPHTSTRSLQLISIQFPCRSFPCQLKIHSITIYIDKQSHPKALIHSLGLVDYIYPVVQSLGAVYKGRPPLPQNLGFSNHPLLLSGCVRISKTTPPPRTSAFFNFYTINNFNTFLFLLIKTKFIAQFSCFYKV